MTATRRGRLFGRGALHLSDAAAAACLGRAHHHADELDLLINAGIYRDHNTAEPADRVPRVRPDLAAAHTAGPIAAVEAAIDGGTFARARHVLFVAAGAGITVAAALYRASA